jgi:hypothetical protein
MLDGTMLLFIYQLFVQPHIAAVTRDRYRDIAVRPRRNRLVTELRGAALLRTERGYRRLESVGRCRI